ncbi:hypothetical protein [Actinopolymorpha pittospori]
MTTEQLDGLACIACGQSFLTGTTPAAAVGSTEAGQLFACADTCSTMPDDEPQDHAVTVTEWAPGRHRGTGRVARMLGKQ